MLITVDHGNKQIKTGGGKVFTSGLRESDTKPPFGEDVLKHNGKYYTLSDRRIPYLREKFTDSRFYILTLFAIAFEIENTGTYVDGLMTVQLAVGLPPAHYGAQFERFEEYFKSGTIEEFEFNGKTYRIFIDEVASYPQAFAAAMTVYGKICGLPKLVVIDIGAFTVDYLMIKSGQVDMSACDSLEHGVIVLYNLISARVNSELDLLLEETDIDAILKGEPNDYGEDVKRIVDDTAQVFISDLLGKLRERAIDLRSGKSVFIGGGSILLKEQIAASGKVASPIFIDNIGANAKGYEILHKASTARR